MRRFGFWFFGVALCLFTTFALAKEVVIVTSFPKELFETYKKTFEAKHPGIKVVINSKQTNAGVTYLRERLSPYGNDVLLISTETLLELMLVTARS